MEAIDEAKWTYIGIDGEGQGREDHRYVMLAAADGERNFVKVIESESYLRLTTRECLQMIISLPQDKYTKVFSFAFNYDLTKILTDVDNERLYSLFHPETRQRKGPEAMKGPYPVKWVDEMGGTWYLNLQGTKFTVKQGRRRVIIWDLFKFYGCRFTQALKDWRVDSPENIKRMEAMKDQRSEFDKLGRKEILDYCLDECQDIALLGKKLIEAHATVGLKLRSFYGAGSSGGAMLTAMGIKDRLVTALPEMKRAVACAFSGGRFENSVVGSVPEKLYSKDISSAYPYHTTFLPCLVHGEWFHTTKREDLDDTTAACVRYGLGKNPGFTAWGPFPFRESDGAISYPIESGGGWVWRAEYLEGEKVFSHVYFREAWVYRKKCECQPFAAIPTYYRLRLQLGKEGPGIVIKLGVNSCYGKLAQSVGSALFNNWIWAGMITSGCRAQMLGLLGMHKDRANLLMIATDGSVSRENIGSPMPRDTGTCDTGKPLGGWEDKVMPRGLFFARPGIYFPLSPTEAELKDVKARGLGKKCLLDNWQTIVESWEKHGATKKVMVANVTRFCGAKSSLSIGREGVSRAVGRGTEPSYGQWISRPVDMDFDPLPKRTRINPGGLTLELRRFHKTMESAPYAKAMRMQAPSNKDTVALQQQAQEAIEQPDGMEISDYEFVE